MSQQLSPLTPFTAQTYRAALKWAAVGLGFHLVLVAAGLAWAEGKPEWFVHFGREYPALSLAKQVLGPDLLVPHDDGHDGQSFWILARNPLLLQGETTLAPYLDRPAYRAQRIGYPAVASVWRLGGEQSLLWGLIATNLVAVFFGGYAVALLAADLRVPMRASLAFALCPGAVIATALDTGDGLALASTLAALLALRRERPGWAVAAGVLGVLSKEVMGLALFGVAVLVPGLPRRTRMLIVAVPAAAAAVWALYVRWQLGWPPSGVQEFSLPFVGYVDAYRLGWRPVGNWADAVGAVALVPLSIFVVWRWWVRRTFVLAAAVPFACLVPFFSAHVLDLALNALRAIAPIFPLLALDIVRQDGGHAPSRG